MRLFELLCFGYFIFHVQCKAPPSFIQSALVLFSKNGTENEENSTHCAGIFVTRQHVLTTLQCALTTKKLQLAPQRILPKPFIRRRRTSMSFDAITGK